MAYDDYRDRGRFDRDEEFGRSDSGRRQSFGRSEESRWPGESSWGYGPEYNEGYPERLRSGPTRSFEGEGRPELTGGATEFHPETTRRYGMERYGSDFGWQPEGGYGQGSGYFYGFDEPAGYYGTSSHLARIPRGRFTGRGPKSYQRSDERIREDVSEEFFQNGELDASEITIIVESCVVTLEGEVEDREQKRLAEDIAEAAPGVREVNNNLKVKKGFFARLFGTDDERDDDKKARASTRESR
jgi:BON domain-containing protein